MLASGPSWDLLTAQPREHKKSSTYISLDAQALDPLAPFSSLSTSLRPLGLLTRLRVLGCKSCVCSALQRHYTICISKTGWKPA